MQAMNSQEKFFYDNAPYSYDPAKETSRQGRMQTAKLLAEAEAEAHATGVTYQWIQDDDPDISWMSEEDKNQAHEVEICIATNPSTGIDFALHGITDASQDYRRVVEAQLALEVL